jgi:PKD repeat protein
MRKGITLEIIAGVFTICAAALVFTLFVAASSRAGQRQLIVSPAGATRSLDVMPSLTPAAAPSPSPATSAPPAASPNALPLTANAPTAITSPTHGGPAIKPTGLSTPTSTTRADQPPTIVLSLSAYSGSAPLTVTVDASRSWDTDGTPIANVVFNFGDGTSASPFGGAASVKHTYALAGIYSLSVVAIDTAGQTSTSFATIAVHPG